jgi:GMP synthase-like glutamine amidotransferase
MDEATRIAIPVSHQDQIVVQPPASTILAASEFTRFGLLAYRDQPAISMQFHPEFQPAFAKALIEHRRISLPDPDAALASLDGPDDRARVAGWIRRFLLSGAE